MIVCNLCAIQITVLLPALGDPIDPAPAEFPPTLFGTYAKFRMVSWISASVSKSIDAVASSIIISLDSRRSARASATSWRWPSDRFFPPTLIFVFKSEN
ncbi:hypothetical protein AYI70_g9611, partial [Smittium culicis]